MSAPTSGYISRVASKILLGVVKIQSHPGPTLPASVATGFLASIVSTKKDPIGVRHLFLVTNKHVVSDWTLADGTIQHYTPAIELTMYGGPGGAFTPVTVPLTDTVGSPLRRLHTSSIGWVDIALVHLNGVPVPPGPQFTYSSFEKSFFLPFDRIDSNFTGLGDQVYAIGYPKGITSLTTSFPIAKGGYIANIPGVPFSMDVPSPSRSGAIKVTRLDGKLLVVDGLIVPGNSGGPVVIPHELKIRRDPVTSQLQFGTTQSENWIVGIVSMGLGASGLTLVYSCDYILDLIDEFIAILEP